MDTQKRAQLYHLLGDLPPRNSAVTATVTSTENRTAYRLEELTLHIDGNAEAAIPAYFVAPHGVVRPPVVLFCHSHGGRYNWGKEELLQSNSYMYATPYADALTAAGYAALCIDYPLFGARAGVDENAFFKEMLWQGKVVWGLMVYEHLRTIDYLHTRTDIDASRLAALGMSMGSTMAWWLAALDERVKVCADICCMTDFHELIHAGGLNAHGIYYYVPSLLKHFDTAGINALIAPRPHISVNGTKDTLTPEAGLDKIDAALRKVYADMHAPDAWRLTKYPVAHEETSEMRQEIMAFLAAWLIKTP